jgi:hypothetical protein
VAGTLTGRRNRSIEGLESHEFELPVGKPYQLRYGNHAG